MARPDSLQGLRSYLDSACSKGSNLQHLLHIFEGYRETILGEPDCPYSPDSAREFSWSLGSQLAKKDLAYNASHY